MSDPYRDAFARDYMASKDFARMYGVQQPTKLRFFQFGLKDAKDPTDYRAPAEPRPVVWFVEHQRLPMFVNKTQHDYLLDRFGDDYWTSENRDLILHAPVMLHCTTKGSNDNLMHIVHMNGFPQGSQWDPIGEESARAMIEYRGDLDFQRDRWRWWLSQHYPELMGRFDSAESMADLGVAFKIPYSEYIRELRGDMGQNEPKPEPKSDPKPEPKPESGQREPNFSPSGSTPKVEVTEDDIPF